VGVERADEAEVTEAGFAAEQVAVLAEMSVEQVELFVRPAFDDLVLAGHDTDAGQVAAQQRSDFGHGAVLDEARHEGQQVVTHFRLEAVAEILRIAPAEMHGRGQPVFVRPSFDQA